MAHFASEHTTVRLDVGLQIIGMHDPPDAHGPAARRPPTRPWRSTRGSCGRSGPPGFERHPDESSKARRKAFFAVTQGLRGPLLLLVEPRVLEGDRIREDRQELELLVGEDAIATVRRGPGPRSVCLARSGVPAPTGIPSMRRRSISHARTRTGRLPPGPTTGPDAPRTWAGPVVIILNSASCRDETLCQRAS
jgi:hypothetical protein